MKLLDENWDAKNAGDRVIAGLVNICEPVVKGAHDSDFLVIDDKAYVVYMANDIRPGESAEWPFVYCVLTIIDVASGTPEGTQTLASSEMAFDNVTLPVGACFVPRMVRKREGTLRCFFASEDPAARQSQTWYRDFDLESRQFHSTIHESKLETSFGVVPMKPIEMHRHVAATGFSRPPMTYGLYAVDSFKWFAGKPYCVLNNFPNGPSSLAVLNEEMDTFKVLGSFFDPQQAVLTESSVQRMADGRWLAVSRQENRDQNYMFAESADGLVWNANEYRDLIPAGTSSKCSFDCFGGVYYLGWQDSQQVDGVARSIFNVEVSRDGFKWERKYRFETTRTFQYPVFREYEGSIYLTVTQGDAAEDRKGSIMFGRLE